MDQGAGAGHDLRILDSPSFSQAFDMEYEAAKAGAAGSSVPGGGMGGAARAGQVSAEGTPGGSAKKRKLGKDGEVKRTRQSQSCDACRARKVKCDRPPPGTDAPGVIHKDVCSHCQQLGLPCTFDYKPKKRGPPNLYLRRRQGQTGPDTPATPETAPRDLGGLASLSTAVTQSSYDYGGPSMAGNMPRLSVSFADEATDPSLNGHGDASWNVYRNGPASSGMSGTLSEQRAMGGSALNAQGAGYERTLGRHVNERFDEALAMTLAASIGRGGDPSPGGDLAGPDGFGARGAHRDATRPSPLGFPSPESALLHPNMSPQGHPQTHPHHVGSSPYGSSPYGSLAETETAGHPPNPFDAFLPRPLLMHIVDLFFDYIYGLTPVIHRPTFMRDLYNKREEQPDQEEWVCLVLSLVCITLSQVPRSFIDLSRRDVKDLIDRCSAAVRQWHARDFAEITLSRHIMLYFVGAASGVLGKINAHFFGANMGLLLSQKLNEEETYSAYDPIEREMRRRMFWLSYGAEVSSSVVQGTVRYYNADETSTLLLPRELDDEYLTEQGFLEQPEDRPSVLSGFYYITKLWRITGQIVSRRRQDRRQAPRGVMLQMRLNEVDELLDRVMTLMDDCPEPLRMEPESDTRSSGGFSDDWEMRAQADIKQIFLDPKASKATVRDTFLVQQANIYVTQQLARFMALQYREELITLMAGEIAVESEAGTGNPGMTRRSSKGHHRRMDRVQDNEEEKDRVMADLLSILQRIPIQIIAVNSLALVWKVRFVASALLDAVGGGPVGAASGASSAKEQERRQKAQNYLWDFLRILSEIEAMYDLNDEEGKP